MTAVLIVVAAVAIGVAAFFMNQLATVRGGQQKLAAELEAQRQKASAAESEARKAAEQLEAKRRELDEAKDKLKDTKKKRFEEAEAAKGKKDLERVRLEVERAMEEKLAQAREEADTARAQAKRLAAELDAAKSRRAAAPAPELTATAVVPVPSQQPTVERVIRELSPEEKARLEAAEKTARQLKGKVDELEAELRKARGRTETDRRVLIVQKGELDIAKDRFRTLETKHNGLLLERDELRKAMWELEKELQAATGKAPTTAQPSTETASDGVRPAPAASTEGDAAKV